MSISDRLENFVNDFPGPTLEEKFDQALKNVQAARDRAYETRTRFQNNEDNEEQLVQMEKDLEETDDAGRRLYAAKLEKGLLPGSEVYFAKQQIIKQHEKVVNAANALATYINFQRNNNNDHF